MSENRTSPLVIDAYGLIAQLSSGDSRIAEAAFQELRRTISDVKSSVYYAACRAKQSELLSYLVELLGESKDPKYLPFIADQLRSEHARVRFFAHVALLRLGTPQALELHQRFDVRELVSGLPPGKKRC